MRAGGDGLKKATSLKDGSKKRPEEWDSARVADRTEGNPFDGGGKGKEGNQKKHGNKPIKKEKHKNVKTTHQTDGVGWTKWGPLQPFRRPTFPSKEGGVGGSVSESRGNKIGFEAETLQRTAPHYKKMCYKSRNGMGQGSKRDWGILVA